MSLKPPSNSHKPHAYSAAAMAILPPKSWQTPPKPPRFPPRRVEDRVATLAASTFSAFEKPRDVTMDDVRRGK